MSFEDEIHEEALYDVSCVVTVHAKHPEWARDSARRRLGTSGMGYLYVPRRRYEGPLNEDQQRAIARYCLSPDRAKGIMEDCPGFPEDQLGGWSEMREAIEDFITHLRKEEIGA